jgi:Protein affecting phage T7 exclusion by the F plasmid
MNPVLIAIILAPIIEIYLFIKIGSQIGALTTITLIFVTAILGIIYARYEGLNTLRSAFVQFIKNEIPVYEIISGAAITFAALLLIIPGFATDIIGFLLIFPLSRKFILKILSSKFKMKKKTNEKFIDGEYEEIEKEDDKKL